MEKTCYPVETPIEESSTVVVFNLADLIKNNECNYGMWASDYGYPTYRLVNFLNTFFSPKSNFLDFYITGMRPPINAESFKGLKKVYGVYTTNNRNKYARAYEIKVNIVDTELLETWLKGGKK